tara:strand:- start:52 stop:294 length:243 start_codon:yes stop_codon:yes gene_type:complete
MKKLFAFVFGLFFFCIPLTVQAQDVEQMPQEEIAEAPSIDPMSKEVINYLLGENMYQGTLIWQGNKISTKFNYEMKKENK